MPSMGQPLNPLEFSASSEYLPFFKHSFSVFKRYPYLVWVSLLWRHLKSEKWQSLTLIGVLSTLSVHTCQAMQFWTGRTHKTEPESDFHSRNWKSLICCCIGIHVAHFQLMKLIWARKQFSLSKLKIAQLLLHYQFSIHLAHFQLYKYK